MRAKLVGCIAGIVVLCGAALAAKAAPGQDDARTAANFLLAACEGSIDSLSAVAQRAKQQGWISMFDASVPERGPLKLGGIWGVSQDGRSYRVATSTGPGDETSCAVMFDEPKPNRDDFLAALANALTIKALIDTPASNWRTEIYQIENLLPRNVVLQFVSSDGTVYQATIHRNGAGLSRE